MQRYVSMETMTLALCPQTMTFKTSMPHAPWPVKIGRDDMLIGGVWYGAGFWMWKE